MRILAAIPHYFARSVAMSPDGRWHGSVGMGPQPRIAALSMAIAALHQLYGPSQHIIDHARRIALPANERTAGSVDVVVCTTGNEHLLDLLPLPAGSFVHHPTNCPGPLLGFECHAVLRSRLGDLRLLRLPRR